MDVISLFQNGIFSVVSPLGTALTEDQLKLSGDIQQNLPKRCLMETQMN